MADEYRTLSPLDDLTGKTAEELSALAETYRAQAQGLVFDAFWPIANMALVVLELQRLAAQAGPSVFVDLSALKIKGLHSTVPVPVFTAPDAGQPALRQQRPRFDSNFDLVGVRVEGGVVWLLVYRALDKAGQAALEYWVRAGDIKVE